MKKYIIPGVVILAITVATAFQLTSNKRKLDKAKEPVDRTKIPVAVKVITASREPLYINAQYPATILPLEDARVFVQSSGIVEWLSIDLGSKVRKNQVIGMLDTDVLELNLKDAQIAFEKSLDDYQRVKDLYDHKAASKVDMLNAKYSLDKIENQIRLIEQQIQNAQIKSPINGIVYTHSVKVGEYVNPGTPIAFVSNVFAMKATVYINQETVYQLQEGQQAIITTSLFNNRQFPGTITFISPVADANHNYQVDLRLEQNEGLVLRGGTDGFVSFSTSRKVDALQIPKSALMTDKDEPYVFVIEGGKALIKNVETGMVKEDQVEVLNGLKVGDQVVNTGQINLREGSIVNVLN